MQFNLKPKSFSFDFSFILDKLVLQFKCKKREFESFDLEAAVKIKRDWLILERREPNLKVSGEI